MNNKLSEEIPPLPSDKEEAEDKQSGQCSRLLPSENDREESSPSASGSGHCAYFYYSLYWNMCV